jgi:hypothetical protein
MILITKIKNYKEINSKILSLIDKIPNNSIIENNENILHTDWNLPKGFKREYIEYFFEVIKPYFKEMCLKLHTIKIEVSNAWFQQYVKNGMHGWHTHAKTNFTNVYFVELPLKSLATEILNHPNLDVNEGDLLTFPAYYYHRSPLNLSEKRKTIISFNSDIYDYNNTALYKTEDSWGYAK